MAELKTQQSDASVEKFLASVRDENRRNDAIAICDLFSKVTGEPPKMWGKSIIGFGSRKIVYDSGRVLDWMAVGFSPRKDNTVLYLSLGGDDKPTDLLEKLGRHKTGKGCLYINKLTDVDLGVLKKLIAQAVKHGKSGR